MISHGGGIYGFSTDITRFPDDNVTLIVLSNIEGAPSGSMANDLAAIYFGEEYEVPAVKQAISLKPEVLKSYTGDYKINDDLIIVISLVGDNLVAELGGRSKFGLLPESETEFFSNDVAMKVTFEKDEAGKITGFILNPGPNGTPANKVN